MKENSKQSLFKNIAIPAVSLTVICLIITALLAGTNALTKDTIEKQAIENAEASRSVVLPDAKSFEEESKNEQIFFKGLDENGDIVGYTFTTKAKGYGGDIEVMTGISHTTNAVSGVVILSQNETPGLGANAVNESFTNQYLQNLEFDNFLVVKNQPPNSGEIQALTGSTITSQAVTDAVNEALSIYNQIKGGE